MSVLCENRWPETIILETAEIVKFSDNSN